jgi:hypothetical protein
MVIKLLAICWQITMSDCENIFIVILTATATCSHYRLFDKILNNLLFVD